MDLALYLSRVRCSEVLGGASDRIDTHTVGFADELGVLARLATRKVEAKPVIEQISIHVRHEMLNHILYRYPLAILATVVGQR